MRPGLTHTQKFLAVALSLAASLALAGKPEPTRRRAPEPERIPRVQIALLLDNSGSMGGLLNQARTQLWAVVNEFRNAKQHGKPVRLELALYEYGDGVKRVSHFTTNLDAFSEQLFGLGIRGGDEHCGEVIQSSVRQLEWSRHPDDLRLIYIAGNEPFTQGPVDFREAIAEAKKRGITVNTIHCGGDDATWRNGAQVAQGSYFTIDHNAQVAQVTAPQDAELARLSAQLNRTYIAYGQKGQAARARQEKVDRAAAESAPAAAAERAAAKSTQNYTNSDWDLVDATRDGQASVATLEEEALPQEMKGMSAKEREAYVAKKADERSKLQKRIQELSEERRKYLAEQAKQQPANATLDAALNTSIRSEGKKRAFTF